MKSRIAVNRNGIEINITQMEGKKEKFLEAFQECSEGRCSCPTQEYQKVETMNVIDAQGTIQLSIKSKENEVIDTKEIEKCLEYTKDKVSKSR